jgi:hypothetical protein
MQIIVDNPRTELMPGAYASIHLRTRSPADIFSVPASALIFNARGLFVATVVNGSHVLVKPVVIARDLGQTVELASGVAQDDRIIENPPDGVASGDMVRVVTPVPVQGQAHARS